MCSPNGYYPGARRTRALYAAEEIVGVALIIMFVIEYWFACTRMIFTNDTTAPASTIPLYTALGNPAFYPLTRWGMMDYVLLCLGPMSIITYGLPLVISWVDYKDWYAFAIAYVILTVGAIIEWVRSIWFFVVMFDVAGFWYSAAYGTILTNIFSQFSIISLFAWIRAIYAFFEFLMIFLLKRQGLEDKAQERRYGINGEF